LEGERVIDLTPENKAHKTLSHYHFDSEEEISSAGIINNAFNAVKKEKE
jgi:hypothetical protein